MTVQTQDNPIQAVQTGNQLPPSDKELNFRKQEQMYQRMLAEKDARIAEIERQQRQPIHEEDESDDPYVDKKKLVRELSKFEQKSEQKTKSEIQNAVSQALAEERRNNWIDSTSDFNEVMQHAEKFAEKNPVLAKNILNMPEGFERQKLVYETIKTLGLHKPQEPVKSIQSTIDANRRSPFYQPTGVGSAPYASQGDFSQSGQKNAYEQMKQRIAGIRLG